MHFAELEEYLTAMAPNLLDFVQNGEVRFLALDDAESTDSQGFPNSDYSPRTVSFNGCVWNVKTAEDAHVADQTKASIVYEIISPFSVGGVEVIVKPSDRCELRRRTGDTEVFTLEIIVVIPQSNISKKIYAIDLDSEDES